MIDCSRRFRFVPRPAVAAALLAVAVGAGGCAGIGDSAASAAFVDPAKYNLYDCKRLSVERKALGVRTAELNGLIRKAEGGVAGSVVAEVAYRNDYISTRAQARLAEEAWQANKCVEVPVPVEPDPAPPPSPSGIR